MSHFPFPIVFQEPTVKIYIYSLCFPEEQDRCDQYRASNVRSTAVFTSLSRQTSKGNFIHQNINLVFSLSF